MASAREVLVRGLDIISPTWKDAVVLFLLNAGMVWFLGLPVWVAAAITLGGCAGLAVLFGWLELLNEAAERQEDDPPEETD